MRLAATVHLSTAPIVESEASVARLVRAFGFGCTSKVASARAVFMLIKAWVEVCEAFYSRGQKRVEWI